MIIGIKATEAANGSAFVFDISPNAQEVGDIIFVALLNDAGNSPIAIAGWTEIAGTAPNNSSRCSCFYIEHTGADITSATATGTNNDWSAIAVTMRGIDLDNIVNVSARSDFSASVYSFPTPAVTTTRDNCLVFRVYGLDGGTYASPSYGYGIPEAGRIERLNNTSLYVNYDILGPAGSAESLSYNLGNALAGTARASTTYTIAFSMQVGADLQPVVNSTPDIIASYSEAPTTFDITTLHPTLLSKPTSAVSISSISRLTSYSPDLSWYGGYIQYLVTVPATLSVQILCKTIPSTDMSVYPYSITFGQSTTFRYSDDGPLFYFRDSAGNYAIWQPLTKDEFGNGLLRTLIAKMPDQTFIETGGAIDWSDIVVTGHGQDVVATNAASMRWSVACECVILPAKCIGGSASRPITPAMIRESLAAGVSIYRSSTNGAGQDAITSSVEIGNLTTKTYFSGSGDSLAYPEDNSTVLLGYKCGDDSHSITLKPSADCVNDLRSLIVRSTNSQLLLIDPSAATSSSFLSTGWILSGFDIAWKIGIPCPNANFVNCGIIDVKGAEFIGGTVSSSISATHAMTATDGAVIGYDFTKGDETYAIELSSVDGTYDLSSATFNGYITELNITAATGTTVIQLSQGQSIPDYDTAGAIVDFQQEQIYIKIPNILEGSQFIARNKSQGNVKIATGFAANSGVSIPLVVGVDYEDGDDIVIDIAKQIGLRIWEPLSIEVTMRLVSASLPNAQQEIMYATAENSFVDGATIPYLSLDPNNPQILQFDIDTAHLNVVTNPNGSYYAEAVQWEMVCWYFYAIGTIPLAIELFFNEMRLDDAANCRMNNGVMLDSIASAGNAMQIVFTDENKRIYKVDGSSWMLSPTTSGYGFHVRSDRIPNVPAPLSLEERARLLHLDAAITSRSTLTSPEVWEHSNRALTTFGSLVSDIWAYANRVITGGSVSIPETSIHSALDSYANKADWKTDIASITLTVNNIEAILQLLRDYHDGKTRYIGIDGAEVISQEQAYFVDTYNIAGTEVIKRIKFIDPFGDPINLGAFPAGYDKVAPL